MTSSLLGLILSALGVVTIFLGFGDRVRGRRERAQVKETGKIKAAVDEAVGKQRVADDDKIRVAEAANTALVQQLAERTEELREARRERDRAEDQVFELMRDRGTPIARRNDDTTTETR